MGSLFQPITEGRGRGPLVVGRVGGARNTVWHIHSHPCLADRHHGTPMLLDGVKCVGAELEYDSEHSDWHGFD